MPRKKNHGEPEDGRPEPRATEEPAREHAGTDIEAFYAAQKESAKDSRAYAARRRQR